jgi:hypothetical protein
MQQHTFVWPIAINACPMEALQSLCIPLPCVGARRRCCCSQRGPTGSCTGAAHVPALQATSYRRPEHAWAIAYPGAPAITWVTLPFAPDGPVRLMASVLRVARASATGNRVGRYAMQDWCMVHSRRSAVLRPPAAGRGSCGCRASVLQHASMNCMRCKSTKTVCERVQHKASQAWTTRRNK